MDVWCRPYGTSRLYDLKVKRTLPDASYRITQIMPFIFKRPHAIFILKLQRILSKCSSMSFTSN